jgi:hypothetical protein
MIWTGHVERKAEMIGIDGMIILKRVLRKCCFIVWTVSVWFGQGTSA